MKKMFMAGLLLAGLATSCSEDLNVANSTHKASLTASVTAEQTRAAFDKSGAFYWSTGDKIGVLTSNGGTMFSSLELKSGAGSLPQPSRESFQEPSVTMRFIHTVVGIALAAIS